MPNRWSTRRCSYEGCDLKHYGRGWCKNHYRKWWRKGTPDALTPLPLQERFERHFTKGSPSDCWQWRASHNHRGYGVFFDGTRHTGAHRVAYELYVGRIPDGMTLDHLCETKLCVNPAHLEPVTAIENHRRYFARRRAEAAA